MTHSETTRYDGERARASLAGNQESFVLLIRNTSTWSLAYAETKDLLVFSDSGIGPNPRVDEDATLVGFESFAWARFEDPHDQITKYWTYDCWPIRRAGFVERYLVRKNLTMRDFAPRLGVRALVTLQREIPYTGGDDGYRNDMRGWLKLAVDSLSR